MFGHSRQVWYDLENDGCESNQLMAAKASIPTISLFWPPGSEHCTVVRLPEHTASDLDLPTIVTALCLDRYQVDDIRNVLTALCDDLDVIRYRQDVLQDLLEHPDFATQLANLLPAIALLDRFGYSARPGHTPLHEVVWRVGQLEAYVECVQRLNALFDESGAGLRAEGLRQLHALVRLVEQDPLFQRLSGELPGLVTRVRNISSVTIGVNLDDQLRPVEATLLAVNQNKFYGASASLLSFLFGSEPHDREWEGIAPLHSVARGPNAQAAQYGVDVENPMLYPLFRDLAQVLKQVSRPVAAALQRYTRVHMDFLKTLRLELSFFLGAVQLIKHMQQSGLPMCRPELAPAEERICDLETSYNLSLAVRMIDALPAPPMVTNDVSFGPAGRILVLTGPNQGGKTTYTQGIGQAQILAQAGLYVPGTRARISPVDRIFTHFPVEERPSAEAGRLGEEAQRLSLIFAHATRHSLVLLNESLSSTSPGESLYLARDIVRSLRVLGTRAVFTTHLHDLAAAVDELNAETPGDSKIASLVSLVASTGNGSDSSIQRTYQIVPGPPVGRSYAREIASRYGISYEQLTEVLRQRGVVD